MYRQIIYFKYRLGILILVMLFGQLNLQARGVRVWTYDELAKASDVIFVIEPIKTENNDELLRWPGSNDNFDFQGLSTTFKVHFCFKGAQPPEEILVKHFGYKVNGMSMGNGPTFIEFSVGPIKYKTTYLKEGQEADRHENYELHPCWLAFLKKIPDGSFVPVAGQIDTGLSFKILHDSF